VITDQPQINSDDSSVSPRRGTGPKRFCGIACEAAFVASIEAQVLLICRC
jgi:hypothetical protein